MYIFVVQDGGPAVLGMPDIDKLGLISVNCKNTKRQVAKDDIIDNSMSESPIQTNGGKCEQFEGEKQDAEPQSQQNGDNTPKSPIVTNPMLMGNNNNDLVAETRKHDSISLLSELLINQSFVSGEERKDDMTMENAKINSNVHESFIPDILKDLGMEAPTPQKKKRRK